MDITSVKDGDIVEFTAYSETLKTDIVVLRAYIHGDITPQFLHKVDIYAKLPLSGMVTPTMRITGNTKPMKPTLVYVPEDDKHNWHDIPPLKGKNVFILIHGINPEEILSYDPEQYGIWGTPYKYYMWDVAHRYIYTHIDNAVILHYIYPSSMKRLSYSSGELLNRLLRTDIEKSKSLYFIGHSMGGLVIRDLLTSSEWIRDITTAAITLNTPHRGSPLASLMFAPPSFWQSYEDKGEEKQKEIRRIRLTTAMVYHSGGGIISQGYLDLRWDHLQQLDKFPQMLSPEIYHLNSKDIFSRYIFTTSTITNIPPHLTLLKLTDRVYHHPTDHIGLVMMQRLMETFGKVIGTGLWDEGDGLVPISSQIPVKYINDKLHFHILGPYQADHIDIFTSEAIWRDIIEVITNDKQ